MSCLILGRVCSLLSIARVVMFLFGSISWREKKKTIQQNPAGFHFQENEKIQT